MQEKTAVLQYTCLQGFPDITIPSTGRQCSQSSLPDQIILRASENIWGFSRQTAVCTESRRDCLCVLLFKVNFLLFLISYTADGPRWSKGQGHAAWQFYLAVSQQANNIEDTPAFVLLGEKYNARTSVTRFIRLIRSCMY